MTTKRLSALTVEGVDVGAFAVRKKRLKVRSRPRRWCAKHTGKIIAVQIRKQVRSVVFL